MEHSIEVAIRQAIDLSRSRGRRLVAVTLRGHDPARELIALARAALARHGLPHAEVRHEQQHGDVRLASIELAYAD